jgi:hypothetical protein
MHVGASVGWYVPNKLVFMCGELCAESSSVVTAEISACQSEDNRNLASIRVPIQASHSELVIDVRSFWPSDDA